MSIVALLSYLLMMFILASVSYSNFKKARLIEDIPTSKTRSAAIGLSEFYGKVIPSTDLLTSPIENKKCVYYSYSVQELRKSGKNSTWVTIASGIKFSPFYLEDETGKILINPSYSETKFKPDLNTSSGTFKDPPENVKNFLKSINISYESLFGMNKSMRYSEIVVEPNDMLYVIGTVKVNQDVKSSDRGSQNLIVAKENNMFILSDSSEKSLVSSLKMTSAFCLIVSAVMLFCILYFWVL